MLQCMKHKVGISAAPSPSCSTAYQKFLGRYFLQYLNKFPFMAIASNFEEITPPPTDLKVPNLQSDFSVPNSVRSNFSNKPPNKILISSVICSSKLRPFHDFTTIAQLLGGQKRIGVCGCLSCHFCASQTVVHHIPVLLD